MKFCKDNVPNKKENERKRKRKKANRRTQM